MNQGESREASKRKFHKLLREIQRNPHAGLKSFYEEYGAFIQATAQTVCRAMDKTCEVVNDVLVKIWKNAGIKQEICNPKGWIYTITVNTAKDAMRQKYTLPLSDTLAAEDDGVRQFLDEDCFYRMIQDLSETEQEILIHKFILHSTFQEIAEDTNRPLTTVSSVYYRALDKLKSKQELI